MVLTILLQSYLFGQVLQQSYSEVHNPTHNPTAFEINAPNPSTILLQSYLFGQVRQQSYYNPTSLGRYVNNPTTILWIFD